MNLAELGTPAPEPGPADWNDRGVVIVPRFFSSDQLADYRVEWKNAHGFTRFHDDPEGRPHLMALRRHGWRDSCPYMTHPALRALCCDGDLGTVLEALTGDEMGVHLNLTGWVSTERDWHADSYLNEPEVGDFYAAVWIALGDIHPDSGPFQYVPGSHRWPQITRETIATYYDIGDASWPKRSEGLLTELFEAEIRERQAEVVTYLPKAGDVLIWHGRLLHRGSKPNLPGIARPALIAHYSGIHHRPRMPQAVQHESGGWFFPIDTPRPVRAAEELYA